MSNLKAQIEISVDAAGVQTGVGTAKRSLADLGVTAVAEGKKAAEGVAAVGKGGDQAAAKLDVATRNMIASIQRTTAATEVGKKTGSEYFAALANQRGISSDLLAPYLTQLDSAIAKQKATEAALNATAPALGRVGVSAAQTAAALRGVPAQFTDIVTSIQGGQAPLTVFLQQGGQLKDMFGGAGPAARALGGYVAGLINPFTVAAAAVGTLALAYYKGSQEVHAYSAALILSGNAAGTTSSQLADMAASIARANKSLTQGASAEALATLAQSGAVGAESLEKYAAAAANFQQVAGQSVEKTADAFKELQKSPLEAAVKLDSQIHFLTLTTYEHIKSLEDQGKKTDAVRAAQDAYAEALASRSKQMTQNLGFLEVSWRGVGNAAKSAWDYMLGIGRAQTGNEQLASLKQQLADRQARGPLNSMPGVAASFEKGNDALRAQIDYIERVNAQLGKQAVTQAAVTKQVQARAEWDKEGDKYLSKKAQRDQATAKVRASGSEAGATEEEIQQRIKDITSKLHDAKGGAPKAYQDDAATKYIAQLKAEGAVLKAQLETTDKLTDAEKKQVEFTNEMAELKGKKILTAEQQSRLAGRGRIEAMLAENVALADQLKKREEGTKLAEKELALARGFQAINLSIASAQDSRNEQYERSLDAFGRGSRAREEVEAQKSIRKEFDRYMLSANEKASAVDPKTGRNALDSQSYKDEVEKIKASLAEALGQQQKYFDDLKAKQADWKNGATEALANYSDAVNNVSASADRALTNAFKGGEDSLTKFITTGKGGFKSLADSIIADLARIAVQKTITGPLAKGLEGILQGDEMKDFLKAKGLIGSSSGEGIDWGKMFSTVGGWFSGKFFADGGSPPVGMASVVGERGPELFVPSVPGTIVPNHALGGGGSAPVNIVINNTVGDVATLSMLQQAQQGTERRIAAALGRSQRYGGPLA